MESARRCQLAGLSPEMAAVEIQAAAAGRLRPGRSLRPGEVERAISTAFRTEHRPGVSAQKVLALSPEKIAQALASKGLPPSFTEQEARAFLETSPVPKPHTLPTAEVLAVLFEPDSFLGFKTANRARAERCKVADLPRFFGRALHPYQFVTSSPITGRFGKTQDGKSSYVARECFTARRFLVIEFDNVNPAEQFARIAFLHRIAADAAPLVMILKSGGKSFHSWFAPQSADAADLMQTAGIKVGADPAAMNVTQSVRCPGQRRDNGNLQQALWFAPHPFTFSASC
jgi:hypothetical protein